MTLFNRLYLSGFINTFGSWLTFLAIALVTQERYGTQYVALVFLVQTLPAIFLSRTLVKVIPERYFRQVYSATQILLALNSLLLVFSQALPLIFAHLLVGSVLKSLSNPVFSSLMGRWVPPDRQKEVFTRVGAIQSGTLAFAPIVGAWLKILTSVQMLFALDAVTFLIAIVLLKELFVGTSGVEAASGPIRWREIWTTFAPFPREVPAAAWRALLCWFLFLLIGAILNAIEFPGFSVSRMSEAEIGYALAAWGAGSLIAFLLPRQFNLILSGTLYLFALLLFVVGGYGYVLILAFLLAGLFSSYFSGSMRARIQQTVPANDNAVHVWAFANQVTQMINLIAYASAGVLLGVLGFYAFGAAMLVAGGLLVATLWRFEMA